MVQPADSGKSDELPGLPWLDGARNRRIAVEAHVGSTPMLASGRGNFARNEYFAITAVIDYASTSGWREAAYFVPLGGGGTLITCDAIQNCADRDRTSFVGGIMTGLMGFKGGVVVPPMWQKFQKVVSVFVLSVVPMSVSW